MPLVAVIGGQWGDEGKAKIVDFLCRKADYVVRFQGGANAGHTVVVGGEKFAFHLIPSGVLYDHVGCVMAGGMVVDPRALAAEMDSLEKRGIKLAGRLFISEQAHVVFPQHVLLDRGEEVLRGADSIGSTGRGITPAYVDKVGREGMRMCDFLLDKRTFSLLVREKVADGNSRLIAIGQEPLDSDEILRDLLRIRRLLKPYVTDTRKLIWEAIDNRRFVVFEGAQGSLLDLDHGTYPFVTSSSASAGGVAVGAGVPPGVIKRVLGVFKAYCTRVGNGPFPTEEKGRIGERLREAGREYGTTTGRPRRCGWFDLVAGRTVVRLNGMTEVALTKLDVLQGFSRIRICTSYRMGSRRFDYFPADTRKLWRCQPVYIELPGWDEPLQGKSFATFPKAAREFVRFIERGLGCRVKMISLGPERSEVITVPPPARWHKG